MSSRVRNTTGYYSASFLNALECFEFTLARAARTLAFLPSESTGAIRMDLPSVVNSTWDSGAILSKSRMGRSMTTAQLFPCFTKFLIIAYPTLQSISMVDQCKYMIAFEFPEVKGLPSFYSDDCGDRRSALVPAIPRQLRFEPLKNMGETPESSVPVLSAAKPWFSAGFSHIFSIALAFLHVHVCQCLQVVPR